MQSMTYSIQLVFILKVCNHHTIHQLIFICKDYQLAKKIAKDALDEGCDDKDDHIALIMSQHDKLEELDLEDYAAHLESKVSQNTPFLTKFTVNRDVTT